MKEAKRVSEIIVPRGKYLSDVLIELPCGIFNKSETGIGATTLELTSERNSIIVQPQKVTASTKAKKHNACYVGSATMAHPYKDKKANLKRIRAYLDDKSIPFKKFLVVSDSLSTLLSILEESSKEYFLLIDEADRVQMDVGFRSTMENVIKHFKNHPSSKRCLLTATLVHFNDPELESEPYYICKFEHPVRRKITMVTSTTSTGVIADKVLDLYKNNTDKIVVALNEFALIREIAHELEKEGVEKRDIQILCSENAKNKAGEYYKQLDSSKLGPRITFKTSAYFNGFDIADRYHLFTYIHPRLTQHVLSDKTIKQIAGRCRHKEGLLSETIIYQDAMKADSSGPNYTIEELKKDAELLINSLVCVDKHFKHSIKLKQQAATIFDDFSKSTSIYGYPLINTRDTPPTISYLSLDAILEMNKVLNTQFHKPDALYKVLSQENNVSTYHLTSTRKINGSTARELSTAEEKKYVDETLTELIDEGLSSGNKFGLAPSFSQLTYNGYYLTKSALELYNRFRLNVDNMHLKELILNAFDSMKIQSQLKKLNKKLTFICADDSDTIKKSVRAKFEIGRSYSTSEIQELMLDLCKEYSTSENIDLKPQVLIENFRMLVSAKLTSSKAVRGRIYKIYGYNTLGIEVFASQKEHLTKSEVFMELMNSSLT